MIKTEDPRVLPASLARMDLITILVLSVGGAALVWAVFSQNRKHWY